MTLEVQRVSRRSENGFGSLSSCLVEGDPQSEKRARRIKQRAVAISIVLQSLALLALILFPLLSQGEKLPFRLLAPVSPVALVGNHKPPTKGPQPGVRTRPTCHFCAPQTIPPTIVSHDQTTTSGRNDSPDDPIPGVLPAPGTPGGRIPTNTQPVLPPPDNHSTAQVRHSVSEMQQMAQLIRRVEPIYPPLARQIQREGRVELHAIISAAGTIESLEVISGDPLFIQSALSAVREWRYRPTILNGRPIEIDTHITVIYTLSH